MTAGNDFDPESVQPKLFSALLTPHRSLNRTGFLVLMAFLSIVSFAAGLAFLLMGAWPVLGFFFLPLTTLAYAFAWHLGDRSVNGVGIVLIVVAVLIDLGLLGTGEKSRRDYRARPRQ